MKQDYYLKVPTLKYSSFPQGEDLSLVELETNIQSFRYLDCLSAQEQDVQIFHLFQNRFFDPALIGELQGQLIFEQQLHVYRHEHLKHQEQIPESMLV